MSAPPGPPRRPPGPPPAVPPARPPPIDASQVVRGVGDIGGPPGAPPPGPPQPRAVKAPPLAPPPRSLLQTFQRPALDSIKPIENASKIGPPPKGPSAPLPMTPTAGGAVPARGPPPKILQPDFNEEAGEDMEGIRGAAAPKFSNSARPPVQPRKPGAVSMFEPELPPQEPAEKKMKLPSGEATPTSLPPGAPPRARPPRGPGAPVADASASTMTRAPRPLPPRLQPAGIPEGHPLPPENKPEKEVRGAAPVKPAPNRNRAPPREEDPNAPIPKVIVGPPTTEPPFKRGKKVEVEEVFVPRRQRENPEFESSSEEEDEQGNRVPKPVVKKDSKQPAAAATAATAATSQPVVEQKPALKLDQPESKEQAPATSAPHAAAHGQPQQFQQPIQQPKPVAEEAAASKPEPVKKAALEPEAPRKAAVPEAAPASQQPAAAPTSHRPEADMPPADVIEELGGNAFVPPPSTEFELDFTSKLAKQLKSGRLSIRCVEGMDVRRKDDLSKTPRTDPFLKFRLGAAERHPWVTTSVKRKCDNFPRFDDEIVCFDVLDPIKYIFQEDLQLTIELWNKSTLRDECIGTVAMSVVRFFAQPYNAYEEKIPLTFPGTTRSNGKLRLEFIFEEARRGMFAVTLYEARGLRNVDPLGKQDPFVQLSLGPTYVKKSAVIKDGGVEPYFAEEELLMFADASNWVNDLQIAVLDASLGMEKPIGITNICLLPYMNIKSDDAKEETLDLFYSMLTDPRDETSRKDIACGEILVKIRFMPAGHLSIFLDRARNIAFPENYVGANAALTRIDAYVQLTVDGKAIKMVKRSPADKDGGADPVWEYKVEFDVVDQYIVDLEIFHQNVLTGNDVLLGFTQLSLLPVFRNGHTAFWTPVKQKKGTGGIIEVGDIRVDMKFEGPLGVAFPQFRPEVDTFDDRMRKMPEKDKTDPDDMDGKVRGAISTIPDEKKQGPAMELIPAPPKPGDEETADSGPPPPPVAEFTEEEIAAAFKFIDLDHNNFVGAKEIRHILVCMGEMITDEEIDTMISLVDADGDGQVSFPEFRTMVLHPDPGNADMHKEIVKVRDEELMNDKQALAGKASGLDFTAYQRQKEMTQREAKKKMLIAFVAENEVSFDYIKNSFQFYLDLPKEKRIRGRVNFLDFCKVLSIEPIAEYKILHSLFDSEENGDVDFREFLLSSMNFVEVNKDVRMRFSFTMFDDRKTGFITKKEIEEILRGNHMISLASVRRKAETVMKQATSNSAGAITMNELVVVAKKFPNIMLPSIGLTKA